MGRLDLPDPIRDEDIHVTRYRTDGAAVTCPECGANFGGMVECPWDGTTLTPLADADPTAVAFYKAIR